MRNMEGLKSPTFDLTGKVATGAETEWLQLQSRKQWYALQDGQDPTSMWTTHTGKVRLLPRTTSPQKYLNKMCPSRTCYISSGRRTAGGMVTIGMSYKNRMAMVKDENVGSC
jgi:hypothetical protein